MTSLADGAQQIVRRLESLPPESRAVYLFENSDALQALMDYVTATTAAGADQPTPAAPPRGTTELVVTAALIVAVTWLSMRFIGQMFGL